MGRVGDGEVKETMKHRKSNSHGDTKTKEELESETGEVGDIEDLHLFQSAMQFDDTFLLESDLLETELVGESDDLSGGTQVLEHMDCENEHGGNDIEEIEITEVPSNGDKLLDGETNVSRIENFDNGRDTGEEVMEKKQLIPLCSHGKGTKVYVVNSDASKDGEDNPVQHGACSSSVLHQGAAESNPGSVWRSFTSVRTTSLRSSGLVAAHSRAHEGTGVRQNSTSSINQTSQKQGNLEAHHPYPGVCGIEKGDSITSLKDQITVTGSEVLEKIHVHDDDTDISHKKMQEIFEDETKSRIKNSRVRKLFFEDTPAGEREEINKINLTTGKVDPPRFLRSEHAVAGLSYVESQEPGIESQANALDMVDRFLLLNDVELSGEVDTGKSLGEKSSLISSAKGAQTLAKRACLRSPVRNAGIYDWVDCCEDETGGEFFSKRKDLLFEDIRSQNPKHLTFGRAKNAVGKCRETGQERGTEIHQKIMGFTCPDTRSKLQSSIESDNIQITETINGKNFYAEQSNVDNSGEQLGTTAIGSSSQGSDDIGVNTQLAAEALEALVCGPPAKNDFVDELPAMFEAKGGFRSGAMKNKGCLKHVSVKRGHGSDSDGTMKQSKQNKMLHTKLSEANSDSEKHLTTSGTKISWTESSVKTRAQKKRQKYEEHFYTGKSSSGNEHLVGKTSRYVTRRQSVGALTDTCIEKVDNCHTSLVSDRELSFGKSTTKEEILQNIVTPIAHRTRKSMMNSLKRTNIPSNDRMQEKNCSRDNGIFQNKRRAINYIAKVPEPSTTTGSSSKFGQNEISKIGKDSSQLRKRFSEGRLNEEKSQISYQKNDSSNYTKRQKTRRSISDNVDNTTNSSVPSAALDGVVETNGQICTREKSLKTNATRTSLSFNTVQRKTRSATRSNLPLLPLSMAVQPKPNVTSYSLHPTTEADSFASEPCGHSMDRITSGRRVYGIRTRSSGISSLCMPSDKKSTEILIKDEKLKPDAIDADVNCAMDVTNDEASPEHVILPTYGVPIGSGSEGGAASSTSPVEGLSKEKGPREEDTFLLPVCTGNYPEKLSGKRCLSRSSLMRKLFRLDITEAKQTTALKDTRRRRDMASVCVLFSHHLGEDIIKKQKKILSRLGVSVASSSSDATHFIADKFVRTRNMLEAMALGKPVLNHCWLESCGQASCFIDEKNYILRDLKKEKEIGFSMPLSLARAYQKPLLQGKRVYITPNVKPDRKLVASLVKAVHGQAIERIGRFTMKGDKVPDDFLVISCEEDYSLCTPLLEKGAEIYSSELLLDGIVIQKLEYARYRLFPDHVRRTRSTIWLRKEVSNQFTPVTRCR